MIKQIFIFMVVMVFAAGVAYAAPADLPKTGQTTSYAAGDDGDLRKGFAWPSPRFTDNGDGTITDNLTGLMWLENANCFGTKIWTVALSDADTLADGTCGLTDSSAAGDWRLPNRKELKSLINYEEANIAAWLNSQAFSNVQSAYYWSSTTVALITASAWDVTMWYGFVNDSIKTNVQYVWPVRAGTP